MLTKSRCLMLIGALAILAGGAAGYYGWRWSLRRSVPPAPVAGVEPDVAAAIQQARDAVVEEPRSAAAWGRVGLILFAHEQYADSLPWLERAEQLDAAELRWPYFRGVVLQQTAQTEAAIAAFRRAAELGPRDPFVRLRLAEALMVAGRPEEAGPEFDQVLRSRPDDARAQLGKGQVLLRSGDAQAAIPLLEAAATSATAHVAARSALAEAYLRLGNESAAEEQSRLAASISRDIPWRDPKMAEVDDLRTGLRARINRALNLGDTQPAVALEQLQAITREHPNSDEAWFGLGRTLLQMNHPSEAEKALSRAIEISPDHPTAYFLLGTIAMQRNDYAGAEKRFRQMLNSRPDHAQAHFNIGLCRLKQGDRPGAIAAWREAIRYRPAYVAAHLAIGEALLDAGKPEEAVADLEAVVRLEPKNEKAKALLARARGKKSG